MRVAWFFTLSWLVFSPLSAGESVAADWRAPIRCPLETAGWFAVEFEGRAQNRLACGQNTLRISSEASISLHYIEPPAPVRMARKLSWEWRVARSGGPSDLTDDGADDRDIALLVAFRYDSDSATALERALRPWVEWRSGEEAPGRVIAYTWAGGGPDRSGAQDAAPPMLESPHGGAAHRIRVLRRGPGPWMREEIDLRRDHARAFGSDRFEIQYIAVASDTDDLGGAAQAEIRALRLSP